MENSKVDLNEFYGSDAEYKMIDYINPEGDGYPAHSIRMKAGRLPGYLEQQLDGSLLYRPERAREILAHQIGALEGLKLADQGTIARLRELHKRLTGRNDTETFKLVKEVYRGLRPAQRAANDGSQY